MVLYNAIVVMLTLIMILMAVFFLVPGAPSHASILLACARDVICLQHETHKKMSVSCFFCGLCFLYSPRFRLDMAMILAINGKKKEKIDCDPTISFHWHTR